MVLMENQQNPEAEFYIANFDNKQWESMPNEIDTNAQDSFFKKFKRVKEEGRVRRYGADEFHWKLVVNIFRSRRAMWFLEPFLKEYSKRNRKKITSNYCEQFLVVEQLSEFFAGSENFHLGDEGWFFFGFSDDKIELERLSVNQIDEWYERPLNGDNERGNDIRYVWGEIVNIVQHEKHILSSDELDDAEPFTVTISHNESESCRLKLWCEGHLLR